MIRQQAIDSTEEATLMARCAVSIALPAYKSGAFKLDARKAFGGAILIYGLMSSSLAYSLGVGGVETRSYIGQPLRIEVPLYNVDSPNALKIDLERINDDDDSGELTATLSRANSQLSVLIRSQEPVNEPYFNFSLNLIDNGNEFRKQFTVLLDLSPTGNPHYSEQPAQTQSVPRDSVPPSDVRAYDIDPTLNKIGSGSVMGPYDWAKAGQIAEKFGAVLDGQSLWRVARRISPAMNASNNQMMWALYQANPQAFSSNSIESLRAGTFLTIPSSITVTSIPDQEAKRLLDSLSSTQRESRQVARADDSIEQDVADPISTLATISSAKPSSDSSAGDVGGQFQLSGLDSTVSKSGSLISAADDQSKEIISSLSETISSMTEQLGRKDKQIEALEAQVVELKTFIQADGISLPETLTSPDVSQPSPSPVISSAEPNSQHSSQEEIKPIEVLTDTVPVNGATDLPTTAKSSSPWYLWVLAALGCIALLGFAMRNRLIQLWYSLNFGREKDKIEFQPTVFNEALSQALAEKEYSHHTVTVSQNTAFSESEYNEPFSDSFAEIDSEIFVDETTPEEELDFEQRFARLLAEGDLEFARQLLDIAHGHDVNDERYHYYRLRLLALNYDEDAFYDYYYSIENDIPHFTNLVQTDISKLVVQLAKH